MLKLCNLGRHEDKYFRAAPIASFTGVLQTLAPDAVVRPRPSADDQGEGRDHWLYVPDEVAMREGKLLRQLSTAWLRYLRPEPEYRQELLATVQELNETPNPWQSVDVDLLSCQTTAGGTAAVSRRQLQLALTPSPDALRRWMPTTSERAHCALRRYRGGRANRALNSYPSRCRMRSKARPGFFRSTSPSLCKPYRSSRDRAYI